MSRPFSLTRSPKAKNGNGRWSSRVSGDQSGDDAELVAGSLPLLPDRYESRPARPFTAIAIRVALWGAVAMGCLGGVVSLLRPPVEPPPPVVAPEGQDGVPAPVAGAAELVVREWLTATPDEEDDLVGLFVEPPVLDGLSAGNLSVGRVTTVAGRVLQENYWAVTVEAEVTELVPVVDETDPARGEAADAEAEEETEERTSTWYLEVPIVGDPETGLLALTRPSVLPGPPAPSTGWRASVNRPVRPDSDDPTLQTVEGFFDALLAGSGDPGRYVAPRVDVVPADPPPFADTEVVGLAIDEMGEGEFRVLAEIKAITPGGAVQMFSYEVMVVERVDRLEITQWAGAPTLVAGSAQPPESDDADDTADDGTTESTTDDGTTESTTDDGTTESTTEDTADDGSGAGAGGEAPPSSVDTTTPPDAEP